MVTEVDQKQSDPERKINLGMVRKEDPFADAILFKVPQVILYHYDECTSTWERGSVEGAFFLYSRLEEPYCAALILNRLSSTNYCQLLTAELEFLVKDRFLLFKEAGGAIHGVCFVDKATAKSTGKELQSVLKNGRASCSAPSPLAPSSHRSPAVPKGKRLGGKTHGGGTKQHDKRKKASSSATEQTDPAALVLASGKTVPPKTSAQQDGGVPAGGIVPADSKPTTQRGMLSLEEVEKTLHTHTSIGSSHPTAPPPKPLLHTSHSQAAADILSMISPPRHHPPPQVATPPSPALPSPVIGTSEDFPENPPLMVSAGMKSGPVAYTPSKSPPPSNHHGSQINSTGHHSDSEVIGHPKQDGLEGWGSRERVATRDQALSSSVGRLMTPQAFVSPRPTPHPQGKRRLPERDQPPTEPSTLSKQQMLNALQYLLVNDEGFVDKLHDAYRKSTSHQ